MQFKAFVNWGISNRSYGRFPSAFDWRSTLTLVPECRILGMLANIVTPKDGGSGQGTPIPTAGPFSTACSAGSLSCEERKSVHF